MSDLNLEFASEDKKISLDGDNSNTGINIKEDDNSSSMLGIDLLTNNNKVNAELNVTNDITGGYSSDEGSVKSNNSKTKK